MKRHNIYYSLMVMLTFFLLACGSDDENGGMATIQVALIDAPADYESVIIDIQDVQVNVSAESETENGWQSLEGSEPGRYDLLLLTNGEEAFLGEIELPEGQLGQVRLILGDENELGLDGGTTDLTVPSGSQSGLKLNVGQEISAGITYKLVIDFDAAKSVVRAGNSGRYNLKPVLRAYFEAQTGAIKGIVAPVEVASVVYAIQGQDSISTYPNEVGEFLLRALEAGVYTVAAVPTSTDSLEAVSLTGVTVATGEITEIDSLILQ